MTKRMLQFLGHCKFLRPRSRISGWTTPTVTVACNGTPSNRRVIDKGQDQESSVSSTQNGRKCQCQNYLVTFNRRTRTRSTSTSRVTTVSKVKGRVFQIQGTTTMAEEEPHFNFKTEQEEQVVNLDGNLGQPSTSTSTSVGITPAAGPGNYRPGDRGRGRGGPYPRPPGPYPVQSFMGPGGGCGYQGRGRGQGEGRGRTHTRWSDADDQESVSQTSPPHLDLNLNPWERPPFPETNTQYFPNPRFQHPHFRPPFSGLPPPARGRFGNNYFGGGGRFSSHGRGQENWRLPHQDAFAPRVLATHHRMSNPFQLEYQQQSASAYQFQSGFQNQRAYHHQEHQYFQYQQIPFSNHSGLFERRDWNNRGRSNNFYSGRRLSLDLFPREWELVQSAASDGAGIPISVMCYNVLAPTLQKDHAYLYKSCNPAAVDWSYRRPCFFKEIESYAPDVICLQEVEADLLHEYNGFFQAQGYSGVFKKRTGDKCDGCAIYYRDSKFNLVDSISVEYCQKQAVPLLDRDNIGILVKLETKQGHKPHLSQKFVIATTHLLFNPKRNDVKIGQAMLLLAELDRMSCYGIDDSGNPLYYPTIVTGDFNVDPNHAISQLFSEGTIVVEKKFICNKSHSTTIPSKLGVSSQCQHYELKHQRRQQFLSDFSEPQLGIEFHSSATEAYVYLKTSRHYCHPQVEEDADATMNQNLGRISLSQRESTSSSSSSRGKGPEQGPGSSEDEEGTLESRRGRMSHAFNFRDVYGFSTSDDTTDKENFVTTEHKKWVRVDYIYYSTKPRKNNAPMEEGPLKLLRRLKLPTRSKCKLLGKIPAEGCSSDHFPLLAEFLLTSSPSISGSDTLLD